MYGNKLNSHSSKASSCRFTTSRPSSVKSTKPRVANPRRIVPSKKIPQNATTNYNKTHSDGILDNNKKNAKPKKTTKSDFSVKNNQKSREAPIDYCKNCGDVMASSIHVKSVVSGIKSVHTSSTTSKSDKNSNSRNGNGHSRTANGNSHKSDRMTHNFNTYLRKSNDNVRNIKANPEIIQEPIKQYYKNENYHFSESTEDISNGIKKISLDTIKEVSELYPSDSLFKIYPDDSEDDITFLDIDDQDSLKQLKAFRQKNYFECHSAKSRIKNKGSATSLQGHRCVYRFYLNDRLFPVPLSTDHNNQVRCVECHLPMELSVDDSTKINGTIQAKVSIGKKNQDIMLLLPVKEPLIITEKRREDKPKDREVVFFGVINLDGFGNSMFNSTMPDNSLALKYQKGYHEFEGKEDYSYKDLNKTDVIVI